MSSLPATLGGMVATWYERPLALWIMRPEMRSIRMPSSTSKDMTCEMLFSSRARSTSRSCACLMVRGKPSRMKPLPQAGLEMLSRMSPRTMSSPTSWPASMTALAALPISVPAATAARSMSPVARWQKPKFSTISGAWVPLPLPGGPKRMIPRLPVGAVAMSLELVVRSPCTLR
eukprot:Amastigsp_a339750_3147.p3 type:complete len:174 gc:universal Amastigsp_a339750_3147:523-2(-)